MGLPSAARFPKATVWRRPERFELVFGGTGPSTQIDVEFRHLGRLEDPETVELQLLAQLQRLGYDVERRSPEDEPEG